LLDEQVLSGSQDQTRSISTGLVQGFSGILPVNIKAPVAKDLDYRLFLQTRGNAHLVLHSRNMTDAPHALYVDGWALSANLSLAVGFKAPMGEAEISRTAEATSVATVDEPAVAPVSSPRNASSGKAVSR
jgi:hypothetical protein